MNAILPVVCKHATINENPMNIWASFRDVSIKACSLRWCLCRLYLYDKSPSDRHTHTSAVGLLFVSIVRHYGCTYVLCEPVGFRSRSFIEAEIICIRITYKLREKYFVCEWHVLQRWISVCDFFFWTLCQFWDLPRIRCHSLVYTAGENFVKSRYFFVV